MADTELYPRPLPDLTEDDRPDVSLVVPVFNEERTIEQVVSQAIEVLEGDSRTFEVIVVDDGSRDGTWATIERLHAGDARVKAVRFKRNFGQHPAMHAGLVRARGDIVVTMDADGQHQPEELPTVVGPIIEGRADHVNGSRMLGDFERESLIRHLGVHFFSRVVTILTGQRVTDISSGYRATRADTLQALILEQDQFWTSEVTIEALRQHARVVEVPVTFLTRRGGVSKKPKSFRYAWNFSKAIVKTWLR